MGNCFAQSFNLQRSSSQYGLRRCSFLTGFIFLLLLNRRQLLWSLEDAGKLNPFSPHLFHQVFVGLSCNLTTFPVQGLGTSPGLGIGPFVCTAAGTAWSKRKQLEEEPFAFGRRAGPCQMLASPCSAACSPGRSCCAALRESRQADELASCYGDGWPCD